MRIKHGFLKIILALFTGGLFLLRPFMPVCLSLPIPEEVVSGSAEFQYPDASTMQINASDKAIINYQSFDIANNESVIINLPSVDNEVLNRVLGDRASEILGKLTCNGIFILVNKNGIYFGPNAQIDVASLIASTRDITNSDFLESKYIFGKLSENELYTLLRNQGNINIRKGGFGVLIAGGVENSGTIIAPVGTIALAGGDMVTLDIAGNGLISVAIDRPTASQVYDLEGKPITDQVKNTGTLQADGGVVLLKAEALPGLFEHAINLEGYVKADKLEGKDGQVKLISSGKVTINAQVNATKVIVGSADEGIPSIIEMNSGSLNAESVRVVADKLSINSSALLTEVHKTGDMRLTSSILQDDLIILEGEDLRVTYLKTNNLTLKADNNINTTPGLIIQANEVKLVAKQFGSIEVPLNIEANLTYIKRLEGNIEIMDSLGIGTSIMLRGPPDLSADGLVADGFGAIIYPQNTSLTLEASKVVLYSETPTYLYGNITFYNFECNTPDKEIYFEAGKTYTFKGNLTILGSPDQEEEYLIKLRSQESSQHWYLNLQTDSYKLNLLNIQDCSSQNYLFIPVGVDAGNNYNLYIDPEWDGGGSNNNWSTAANWVGDVVPSGTQAVTFSGDEVTYPNADKNCTIDDVTTVSWSGGSLTIGSGYSGTITQNVAVTTGAFSQAGGTFTGGAYNFAVTTFSLSGGTFTAPTATLVIKNTFTISGGTFNHNSGVVGFAANNTYTVTTGGANFYGVLFDRAAGIGEKTITLADSFSVAGSLTVQNSYASNEAYTVKGSNNPTITVSGNLNFLETTQEGLVYFGDATNNFTVNLAGNYSTSAYCDAYMYANLTFNGTGTQTISPSYTEIDVGTWTINKTSGTASLNAALNIIGGNLTISQGTFNANGYGVYPTGLTTVSGGTFSGSTADHTFSGGLTVSGGTFTGGSGTITVATSFSLSGGTFTSTSGYLIIQNTFGITGGTFSHNSGTVSFQAVNTYTITTGGANFYNVVFNKGVGATEKTLTLADSFSVAGTLTAGNSNASNVTYTVKGSNNPTITVSGNLNFPTTTQTGITYFGDATNNFTVNLTGNYTMSDSQAYMYANLTFPSTVVTITQTAGTINTGTWTISTPSGASLASAVTVGGNLTINSGGILDTNGYALTVSGTFSNLGEFWTIGSETLTLTMDTDSGTVKYIGGGSYTGLKAGNSYYNLGITSGGTYTLNAALDVNGALTISSGTLACGAYAVSIGGDFANSASFTTSGTVTFDGSGTSTISGSTTFNNFACATAGKQLTFTAGTTQTINGTLTLTGASADSLVILRSSSSGTTWGINNAGDSESVSYVDAKDSINSGSTITTSNSVDSGNNTGWAGFPAGTLTWDGSTDTAWNKGSNWDGNRIPGASDSVVVADVTNDPILDSARAMNNLTINTDGILDINGNNLTLTGTFTNNGTLKLQNSETLSGFSNGTDTGTIQYTGTSTYTGFKSGNTYNNLTISGNGTYNLNSTLAINGDLTISNGALACGIYQTNIGGSFSNSSSFTTSASVIFTATSTGKTITSGGASFTTLYFNGSGGEWTLQDPLDVNTNIFIEAGTLDVSASNYQVNVAGSWTDTGAGTFTERSGTVVFDGTGTLNSNEAFNSVTINSAGTVTLGAALDVNGALNISSGTLDLSGYALDLTGGSFSNDGTLKLQGAETLTNFTNDADTGTIQYTGTSTYTGLKAGNNYNNLTFSGSGGTFTLNAALDVNGDLTLTAGTLDLNGQTIDLAGSFSNSGTLKLVNSETLTGFTNDTDTGTIEYYGTSSYTGLKAGNNYNNLTFSGGGTYTLNNNLDVNGDLSSANGTLNANGQAINVAGNWSYSGGTFTHSNNTVTFDGSTASSISGSTTFYSFTCATAGKSITFAAGSTQTVAGTLTLTGSSGSLITLISSSTGTQWKINPQGTISVSYVDIKDSNNLNGTDINPTNSVDSGNNTYWFVAITQSQVDQATQPTNTTTPPPATIVPEVISPVTETAPSDNISIGGGQEGQTSQQETTSPVNISPETPPSGSTSTVSQESQAPQQETQAPEEEMQPQEAGGSGEKAASQEDVGTEEGDEQYGFNFNIAGVEEEDEENKYKRKYYIAGKYKTVVIVIEGRVVVAPYDEQGPKYKQAKTLTTKQKLSRISEIK